MLCIINNLYEDNKILPFIIALYSISNNDKLGSSICLIIHTQRQMN